MSRNFFTDYSQSGDVGFRQFRWMVTLAPPNQLEIRQLTVEIYIQNKNSTYAENRKILTCFMYFGDLGMVCKYLRIHWAPLQVI